MPPYQDDDQEEEEFRIQQFADKHSIIFLLDCSKPMMAKGRNANEASPLGAALQCISEFMRKKILEGEKDTMGLVLYGVKTAENPMDYPNINVLFNVDLPDVRKILDLEELEQGLTYFKLDNVFEERLGSSGDFDLGHAFHMASNMFSASGQKNAKKFVYLITCQDNPHAGNHQLVNMAKTRARDLTDLQISIELFGVNPSATSNFDISKFYGNMAGINKAGADVKTISSKNNYEELHEKFQLQASKKRTAFQIPFRLANDLEISIRGYNLLLEKKRPSYTWLEERSNSEVQIESFYVCETTAKTLLPTDMKHYFELGGERAIFTKDEIDEIRNFGPPGLELLGFRSRSFLKEKWNLKPSVYICADEKVLICYSGHHGQLISIYAFACQNDSTPKDWYCKAHPAKKYSSEACSVAPNGDQLFNAAYWFGLL